MSRPEKYVWREGDVQVTGSPDDDGRTDPCQACGRPADDPVIRGLCTPCAATIDTDYERLRDQRDLAAGP